MKHIYLSLAVFIALAVTVVVVGAQAAATSGKTLVGTTGPGFTITLKTQAGKTVKKIKRGTYTIKIRDRSSIHNFHLKGPGSVNKKTTVPFVGTKTWKVKLVPGTYRYRCDIHVTVMHGSFKVVS